MSYNATAGTAEAPASHASRMRGWRAAVGAGLLGGAVFMMAEMLMVWLFLGESPWGPPRMIAAMVMGRGVLPPPADLALAPMTVAMIIHFMLSIVYGLAIGFIVRRLDLVKALLSGAAFGLLAIYLWNFHLVAPLLFPWFTQARNWVSVSSHVLFGMVVAGTCVVLRDRQA